MQIGQLFDIIDEYGDDLDYRFEEDVRGIVIGLGKIRKVKDDPNTEIAVIFIPEPPFLTIGDV